MSLTRSVYRTTRSQIRRIHHSSSSPANPIPHPPAPGPPPKPPTADPTFPDDRLARKRKQAELLKAGFQTKLNPAKPASNLQKRFWKSVSVDESEDGYQILLDSRPVRTASKDVLNIPRSKPQLATAIAHEWGSLVSAQQALKQHYIPLTALTSRALDIETADQRNDSTTRDSIVKLVMGYLHTDTLLCWAPERSQYDPEDSTNTTRDAGSQMDRQAPNPVIRSETLRQRQMRIAAPIIKYLSNHVWPRVELKPALDSTSILPSPQPDLTNQVVSGWVSGLSAYDLAGLERAVLASKSLCIAARLLVQWSMQFKDIVASENFGIEDAAEASSIEVSWQTQMWGEVEDTHDVDKEDLRTQLGGVVMLISGR